jgi:hypothetical protein
VPAVALHAADHVRTGAEHDRRAGVDHGVGEGARVATILTQVVLAAVGRVQPVGALRAGVNEHDHDRRAPPRSPDQRLRARDVQQVGVKRVGGEAPERHPHASHQHAGDLARQPGMGDPRVLEGGERLRATRRPEVHRLVVGLLTRSKPSALSATAVDGGAWKAKQVGLATPAPHLEAPPVDSVPSRLPRVSWAPCSRWLTGASALTAPPGGRPRRVLRAMSPTRCSSPSTGGRA